MPKHTPTADQIIIAVSTAFNTTPDLIRSESRKIDAVVPREVCMYLFQVRALMTVPQIANEIGCQESNTQKRIALVRGRARVDTDFYHRIMEAERILLK